MPFCGVCGAPVEGRFCAKCGSPLPGETASAGPGAPPPAASPAGLTDNAACALCYALGFITGILFLVLEPYSRNRAVRFHAFQGLYLFVAWLMNAWVVRPISAMMGGALHFGLHSLVDLVLLIMSIFMIIKAAHDQAYALPLFGELAQRSVAER